MARRVFFSFRYEDVWRANVVRHSWVAQGSQTAAGFVDAAEFEKLKLKGEDAVKRWIDGQLRGTSVTAVLVGKDACTSRWVKYEIKKSQEIGNAIIGINISKIASQNGRTTTCCGAFPSGYPFYRWVRDDGYKNLGKWIETAAKRVGR